MPERETGQIPEQESALNIKEISNDLKEAKQQLRECMVIDINPPKNDPGFMRERAAHNQNIADLTEDINREGKIPEYLNKAYQQVQKKHANLMKRAGLELAA
ncbi:MAG: hypothetical protein WCV50_06840 [Patescibacteria group bacterium]|jgi:hypothetical protein